MKNITIATLALLFLACKGGKHQEILLNNTSEKSIYYILHKDSLLTLSDVSYLRPEPDSAIIEHFKNLRNYSKSDSLEIVKSLKIKSKIKPSETMPIIGSGFVGIYRDGESIQERIKNQYHGRLYVSVITEGNLKKHSNMEIINNGLYDRFLALGVEDIKKDTMVFVYK